MSGVRAGEVGPQRTPDHGMAWFRTLASAAENWRGRESLWLPPPIRPEGFQFEIQISSLGTSYDPDRVRRSIRGHDLGEYESAVSSVMAAEWGYSFTHLDGQVDGAGRQIQAGYPVPPVTRADCLPVMEAFLQRQYVRGAPRPWSSMNGHFPWHHYAAEFGFDQIGSEIGENINGYQWHIALNRGAARQYRKPWFIDFSAWHGPSITDYSEGRIWGEHSGPDHGHSMSLFERSLFMSYLAGAGQITAEAGGAIAFLTEMDDQGRYRLSPYGEVCRRFREFTQDHPDVGIPCTPFAVVLDRYHGAYPGFGERRAFWHFPYNAGDEMTWKLIDLLWPGSWEVMGREEEGTLVSGPFGDTFDILLQNAPLEVLELYPCLILSGDLRLSPAEVECYQRYVRQGGTLILNTAYLPMFPAYTPSMNGGVRHEVRDGAGRVRVYGPDFEVDELASMLREELAEWLPVEVTGDVQYLVNIRGHAVDVTLINNHGVTKAPRQPPRIDPGRVVTASVRYRGDGTLAEVRNLRHGGKVDVDAGGKVLVQVPPGEVMVLAFQRRPHQEEKPGEVRLTLQEPMSKLPVFELAADGGFSFDTGVLRGRLRAGGKSMGLQEVVHIPSGTRLDRGHGLLGHYRLLSAGQRYGTGAWDAISAARRTTEGGVEVHWPRTAERPFELRALYRWLDPVTLELTTTVVAREELQAFEVFLASYLDPVFDQSWVRVHAEPPSQPKAIRARREVGEWQMYPRDAAAAGWIRDGRWSLPPNPVDWVIGPRFERPLLWRQSTASGWVVALVASPDACFALATPHETESHYSQYLSLFGRDLSPGDTATARVGWTVRRRPTVEELVGWQEEVRR